MGEIPRPGPEDGPEGYSAEGVTSNETTAICSDRGRVKPPETEEREEVQNEALGESG